MLTPALELCGKLGRHQIITSFRTPSCGCGINPPQQLLETGLGEKGVDFLILDRGSLGDLQRFRMKREWHPSLEFV